MTDPTKDEQLDLYKRLRRLPIFWRISEEGVLSLIKLMQLLVFPDNQVIFNENEDGDSLFIILSGQVEIFRHLAPEKAGEPAKTLVFARMGENMIFGEMTLLAPGKRTAGSRAVSMTTLLRLEKRAFKIALDEGRDYAFELSYNIGCIVCERLRLMDNRIIKLMQENEDLKKNLLFQSLA